MKIIKISSYIFFALLLYFLIFTKNVSALISKFNPNFRLNNSNTEGLNVINLGDKNGNAVKALIQGDGKILLISNYTEMDKEIVMVTRYNSDWTIDLSLRTI